MLVFIHYYIISIIKYQISQGGMQNSGGIRYKYTYLIGSCLETQRGIEARRLSERIENISWAELLE